ncbi:MAG: colicin [Ignavibacteria bacterium]|jgi:hypothetical protein
MELTNEKIRLALQMALLGEIYGELRAVVYKYNSKEKSFLIRYYLNRKPTEYDYESISVVMAEFISNFKYSEFEEIKEECVFSSVHQSKLESLDGFVYLKKEDISIA